jgi:hypothetical protein
MERRTFIVLVALALAGCAGNALPPPNSAQAQFDGREQAVRVVISNIQPVSSAALIGPDGSRIPATAVALISGPHVEYSAPPSVGLGIGGFGFGGCCSGFGSGVGVGLPLGGPSPSRVDDQYVASAVIPAPPDYAQRWGEYRVQVQIGDRPMFFAAPAPSAG